MEIGLCMARRAPDACFFKFVEIDHIRMHDPWKNGQKQKHNDKTHPG